MAIKQLVPSRDWVNVINQNFNELAGSDTGWTKNGVVGVNGFDASNVSYRISTLKAGDQTLRIAQVDGWGYDSVLENWRTASDYQSSRHRTQGRLFYLDGECR